MKKNTKCVFISAALSFVFCAFYSCEKSNENSKNQWEEYVDIREGNIPLILVATHGGDQRPQWIMDRACSGSVITQDQYTLGIAIQIEKKLNELGYQPYIVLSKIHRIKVDFNRTLAASHCEDDTSNPLWQYFHDQIRDYREKVVGDFGKGLLIDIHGHAHENQRIELGYLLTSNQLRALSQDNIDFEGYSTSIKNLVDQHPNDYTLKEMITGDHSLGTLLAQNGFPTVPSKNDEAPLTGEPFFSGGTNTKVYGSKTGQSIDAIQLELNRQGLRSDSNSREQFSSVFSSVIIEYLTVHYSDVFSPR